MSQLRCGQRFSGRKHPLGYRGVGHPDQPRCLPLVTICEERNISIQSDRFDFRQECWHECSVGSGAGTSARALSCGQAPGGWPIPRFGRGGIFGSCSGVLVGWCELISFETPQRRESPHPSKPEGWATRLIEFAPQRTVNASQAMAFFMSNGCIVVWGMDLKWKSL